MRYLFNSPTLWSAELVTFMCGALYTVAGGYVLSRGGHVKVDVLYMRWSLRKQAFTDIFTIFLFLAFCGALLYAGVDWTWTAIVNGNTTGSHWDPIVWPVRMLIPLSAFLLILQGIAKFIRDLTMASGRSQREY